MRLISVTSVVYWVLNGLQLCSAWSMSDVADVAVMGMLGSSLAPDVCFDKYGCFNRSETSPDWDLQISNLPMSPEENSVKFFAFTCRNKFTAKVIPYNMSDENLKKTLDEGFDPTKRTIFIVHGFSDNFDEMDWMGDIKDTILSEEPCQYNVMATDWHNGSQTASYFQALANTQVVGAVVADFIQRIGHLYKLTNDDFTIMGHSLGAHISGFAGKRLQKPHKLRNIIGLDPAGPGFTHVSDKSRLSYQDANLVVTIHTDGAKMWMDGFGIHEPLGHYNFYPNDGSDQPGCETAHGISDSLIKGLSTGLRDTLACSHRRATYLASYNESSYNDCESMGYRCKDNQHFLNGECGVCGENSDMCFPFGLWYTYWQSLKGPLAGWTKPLKYYVFTNDQLPYSLFHYQLIIYTGLDFTPFNGTLQLVGRGICRNNYNAPMSLTSEFYPNREYHLLYLVKKNIGPMGNLRLQLGKGELIGDENDKKESPKVNIKKIRVNFMSAYNQKRREEMSRTLRPVNFHQTVTADEKQDFQADHRDAKCVLN